ncbi:MAG: hypothetical protein WCO18_02665, partial [bacterium]
MKNKAKNSMIKIKKLYKTSLFVAFAILTLGFSSSSALAMAPTLSVYSNSNNLTQISVNGDSNSSVILYYYPNGGNSVVSSALGSTNQNGYFNTTVNTNTYNISSNSSVYVVVDGAQSNTINWPYNSFNNISGNLYLNQSSIYIDSGHTVVDYINGGSGYYVSSDSNSGVATAYITGNAVNVSGYSSGTADITICSNYSNSGCVILHVTVNGDGHNYYQNSPVSLSQSSVSVGIGQSANVGISGGTGTYYVSSNLNQYLATVSISGNTLTVYGRQVGSESVTVCSTVQNGASNNISNSY